jgi:hypothetical protein
MTRVRSSTEISENFQFLLFKLIFVFERIVSWRFVIYHIANKSFTVYTNAILSVSTIEIQKS